MSIFSGGYLAVAIVFILLFWRALQKRGELELSELEVFETRVSIGASMMNGFVAVVSLLFATLGGAAGGGMAGVIYPILIMPMFTIFYTISGRRKRAMEARLTAGQGA
jgi:hypothetical protein